MCVLGSTAMLCAPGALGIESSVFSCSPSPRPQPKSRRRRKRSRLDAGRDHRRFHPLRCAIRRSPKLCRRPVEQDELACSACDENRVLLIDHGETVRLFSGGSRPLSITVPATIDLPRAGVLEILKKKSSVRVEAQVFHAGAGKIHCRHDFLRLRVDDPQLRLVSLQTKARFDFGS